MSNPPETRTRATHRGPSVYSRHTKPAVWSALGALMLATLVVGSVGPVGGKELASVRSAPPTPNVLIIMTDDQRAFDTLEFMPRVHKHFAKQGVEFSTAYATTPLCCPSRASILSGQYAHNHQVRTQRDGHLLNQDHTFQRYLHDDGYLTAFAGKYLNHWPVETPPKHFDRFSILERPGESGYYGATYNIDNVVKSVPTYSTDFLGRRTVKYLRQFESFDETPWLMMVTPFAPHSPYISPPRHDAYRMAHWAGNPAAFETDVSDKPPSLYQNFPPNRVGSPSQKLYEAQSRALLAVDELVGKVFTELDALDEADDTLAIFMSDNGYAWGEHGLYKKRSPYPESVQIPMLARWPGRLAPNTSDDRLVANIDVLPTVLDAAGLTSADGHVVDGRSLLSGYERDRMYLEYFLDGPRARVPSWASLVNGVEQYSEYYDDSVNQVTFREYYDVVADPWRLTNLLGDGDPLNDPDPLTLTGLSQELGAARTCAGATCP